MDIAVFGTINQNGRRRIAELMAEIDTSPPIALVAACRRKGRAVGRGAVGRYRGRHQRERGDGWSGRYRKGGGYY